MVVIGFPVEELAEVVSGFVVVVAPELEVGHHDGRRVILLVIPQQSHALVHALIQLFRLHVQSCQLQRYLN